MGIRGVTYKSNGERQTHDRACFGFLAGTEAARGLSAIGWMPIRGSNVDSIFSPRNGEGDSFAKFKREMEEILDTVPMFSEFSIVDRNARFEDYEIKAPTSLPADQIILGFFFLRNVAFYANYGDTYVWLRNNTDLPIAACLALSHMFSRKKTLSSFDNENLRWRREHIMPESTPIHFRTFGKFSFNAFVDQDENYRPWRQQPMAQRGGYKRDSQFSGERVNTTITNTLDGVRAMPSNPDIEQYMATALTISETEAPFHEEMSSTWAGSDAEFLSKVGQARDETVGVSDDLAEAIRWASLTPEQRSEEIMNNPRTPNGRLREAVCVKLSEAGRAKYQDSPFNPHDQHGFINTVQEEDQFGYVYAVRWAGSNFINDYCEEDLEIHRLNP